TGNIECGFWRSSPTTPGSQSGGSHRFLQPSTLSDDPDCVIKGTVTLTVVGMGASYKTRPESIISAPKRLEAQWDVDGLSFKKFLCLWDGSGPTVEFQTDLKLNHFSEGAETWVEHRFTEPKHGDVIAGELHLIGTGESSGTMLGGIWRPGKAFTGS
ncbi:hypothetical protein BGW36DRAFT_438294, partial [Talaromyces proteolyticus]